MSMICDGFGKGPEELEDREFVADKVGVFYLYPYHLMSLPVANGIGVVVNHGVTGDIELVFWK